MAKLNKFTDKVKKLKRKDTVYFIVDDGETIGFEIQSLGQDIIDEINAKYNDKMPQVPTKRLPTANGKAKIVENPEDSNYKKQVNKVVREKLAEMALMFLVEEERPEGDIEEQKQALREVEVAGFIPKIVDRGLELSGLIEEKGIEEDLDEVKNN